MTLFRGLEMNPEPPVTLLSDLTGSKWTEMQTRVSSDYLNFGLCFTAHDIIPLRTVEFPILLASHNIKRNSIMIIGGVKIS